MNATSQRNGDFLNAMIESHHFEFINWQTNCRAAGGARRASFRRMLERQNDEFVAQLWKGKRP